MVDAEHFAGPLCAIAALNGAVCRAPLCVAEFSHVMQSLQRRQVRVERRLGLPGVDDLAGVGASQAFFSASPSGLFCVRAAHKGIVGGDSGCAKREVGVLGAAAPTAAFGCPSG